jgi:hypothetical protein
MGEGVKIGQNCVTSPYEYPYRTPYRALPDSCVDPYRKTMEFHMKNLYECAHFPYLEVQKRGEKGRSNHHPPKEFPYGFKYPTNIFQNPYGAYRDSCVDPYRKTMEFHMKNLYGGAKKRRKKGRLNHHPPKEFPYGFKYGFYREHSIPPTTSSSALVRILVDYYKIPQLITYFC